MPRKEFLNSFLNEYRIKKSTKGHRGGFLVPDDQEAREYVQNSYIKQGLQNYPAIRTISSKIFDIATELDIYDNKVCIILKNKKKLALLFKVKLLPKPLILFLKHSGN